MSNDTVLHNLTAATDSCPKGIFGDLLQKHGNYEEYKFIPQPLSVGSINLKEQLLYVIK